MANEQKSLLNDLVEIDETFLRLMLCCHSSYALNDFAGATRVRYDPGRKLSDLFRVLIGASQPPQARLAVGHDRRKRLVDFMRNRRRQLAESCDTAGVSEVGLQFSKLLLRIQSFADVLHGYEGRVQLLGQHRICDREQDIDKCAIEGENPGLGDEIPPAFEMVDHDAFGEPGGGRKNVSNGLYEIGGVGGTKQRHRIPIDFRDAHDILGVFNKVRILGKIGCDIADAVCLQLVERLARPPGIDLPERGRQILNQFTVSLLARLQFPGGPIVICRAVDRHKHRAGRLLRRRMPCPDGGIAYGPSRDHCARLDA